MRALLFIILVFFSFTVQAASLGVLNNVDVPFTTFCKAGYTDTVRPPVAFTNAIKAKLLKEQNLPGSISDYELDHAMPLGLNGAPKDIRNLQMQKWDIAFVKDADENRLRREVCTKHSKTLKQAQDELTSKWGR